MAASDEDVKNEGKKSPVVLIAIIGVVVFLLIIGIIVAMLLMGGGDDKQVSQAANTPASHMAPKQRSNDFFNIGHMYPMDQYVVNLLSESGTRYLKTTMNLELSEQTLSPEIDKKQALIRDIIIRTLSAKTYEDVSTAKGKERLKDELVTRINEVLRDGYIKNVFFTDFIVQ